jgi:hypothetical protein
MRIKRGAASAAPPVIDEPTPTPTPAPAPGPKVRPLVPPRAPRDSRKVAKVLLTVLDGKIEWEKMSGDQRKQFEDLFKNPDFLKQFGVPARRAFDPKQMKALYDGMSMIYKTVCGLILRWPAAAVACLTYSAEQKEILAEPTADLLDRLAPKLISQNSELVMFLMIFGAVTQKNFMEGAAIAKAHQLKAKGPAAPGPGGPRAVPSRPAPAPVAIREPAEYPAPSINVGVGAPPSHSDSLDDFSIDAGENAAQEFARTLG